MISRNFLSLISNDPSSIKLQIYQERLAADNRDTISELEDIQRRAASLQIPCSDSRESRRKPERGRNIYEERRVLSGLFPLWPDSARFAVVKIKECKFNYRSTRHVDEPRGATYISQVQTHDISQKFQFQLILSPYFPAFSLLLQNI